MSTEMLNTVKNFLESRLSKKACLLFLFNDIVCLVYSKSLLGFWVLREKASVFW